MGIGIVGAAGRMGRALVQEVTATEGCRLAAAIERAGHEALGQDAGVVAGVGALNVVIGEDAKAFFEAADAVIEFSSPAATVAHAALAAAAGTAHVIGTTGLDAEQTAALERAAGSVPIVWAPNMSVGVNLLLALVRQVAGVLDEDFDIEVLEMHHHHKVDAPSGTALALGRAAAEGRKVALDEVACRARDGQVGARPRGEIGFATLRGGDVVGDHTVMFAGPGERIELTHKASSRQIFARGAVRSALWVQGRKPALYGMRDVLGLAG
ncbi:MAG: 4-hydroxy-tetrahydrodipicolinate reductase [Rhodospirillaceae bacterium]|nr:4-hydroxy-tetrahydrodipicolinate reductase [Rhodospirillaceae bacterium]